MAQGRMLRKDICESDSFSNLNDSRAQLLCCLLTPWWDDHGKMIGDPRWIKGNIVRKLTQFTEKEISRCLIIIDKCLDVQWWEDEKGNKWLYWSAFDKHQTISQEKKTKDNLPSPKIPKNPQESSSTREDKISRSKEEDILSGKPDLEAPINYLNEKTKSKFDPKNKSNQDLVKARFNEGRTLEQFKQVIDTKTAEWLTDPKMMKYLRPSTLFTRTNFENYLNQPRPDPMAKYYKKE